jgi:hypothetical protein
MLGHFITDAELLALAATIVRGYVNRLRDGGSRGRQRTASAPR